jgi:putative hydrolase of the HAD superfamily
VIYRDLLFDLDHTLLDFNAAEDVALTELLTEARVGDVETYKEVYIPMNRKL